jgi:glutaminase
MQHALDRAVAQALPFLSQGKLADYIPALNQANKNHLGAVIQTMDGQCFSSGDTGIPFSIQSISKIFSLIYVLNTVGIKSILERVGVEPSGNPFYSLVQLEYESGKPRNPLINAGAIAVTSLIDGHNVSHRFSKLLNFLRTLSGNKNLKLNEDIYRSEAETSHRNRAVGHFMKHFGLIEGSVDEAVDCYFEQCSIEMTCEELARAGSFLANNGHDPFTKQRVTSEDNVKFANAIMTMCGLYDASGEFACKVGLPGKSGVGGGILAIVPGKMSIATFGPALDEKGNSMGGLKILEFLSQELKLSLYR